MFDGIIRKECRFFSHYLHMEYKEIEGKRGCEKKTNGV
jgi:hypothetical protein